MVKITTCIYERAILFGSKTYIQWDVMRLRVIGPSVVVYMAVSLIKSNSMEVLLFDILSPKRGKVQSWIIQKKMKIQVFYAWYISLNDRSTQIWVREASKFQIRNNRWMSLKAGPLLSGTIRKLVKKGIHLISQQKKRVLRDSR